MKTNPKLNLEDKLNVILNALDDKKAEDVVKIKMPEGNGVTDYMVIATGNSDTHVRTLARSVHDELSKANDKILSAEGEDSARWVLVDTGNVIVHIFLKDVRELYNLERLWTKNEHTTMDAEDVQLRTKDNASSRIY